MNNKPRISKLSGSTARTNALKRNLLTDLVVYEHVETTAGKAKAIIPLFDKVVNIAKGADKRIAENKLNKILLSTVATKKVIEVLAERLSSEQSGYLNYYKTGRRKGDNAPMVKMMVKGYVYKEIGTSSKTKKRKTQDSKTKTQSFKVDESKAKEAKHSQVASKATQGKVKSRSGI